MTRLKIWSTFYKLNLLYSVVGMFHPELNPDHAHVVIIWMRWNFGFEICWCSENNQKLIKKSFWATKEIILTKKLIIFCKRNLFTWIMLQHGFQENILKALEYTFYSELNPDHSDAIIIWINTSFIHREKFDGLQTQLQMNIPSVLYSWTWNSMFSRFWIYTNLIRNSILVYYLADPTFFMMPGKWKIMENWK